MSTDLTLDVFSIGANGEYEGEWGGLSVLRADFGVDVGGTVEGSLSFCHGVDISVGGNLSASAQAAVSVFVAAAAEVQAFAAAGAQVKVRFSPNLFDEFGVVVDAGAFAEASVAGRLSIGLDIGQILQLAESRLPNGLAIDLFRAFMDELNVRAGIWGRASFSAMARGHLEIYGSLKSDETSGFVFEAGGSVGLKGGTGWDLFAVAELRDPRRFYGRATQLIVDEVVRVARSELPREYQQAIPILELCLPIGILATFELGQVSAEYITTTPDRDRSVEGFVHVVASQMQRFMLRQIIRLSDRLLSDLLERAIIATLGDLLTAQERQSISAEVDSLLQYLDDGELDTEDLLPIISGVVNIATIVAPNELERWKSHLTVMWTAMSMAEKLGSAAARAGVGGSILGLGASASFSSSEENFDLGTPPDLVLEQYEALLGGRPNRIRFADGVDYFVEHGIGDRIHETLPELGRLMLHIEAEFDISTGDIMAALLLTQFGANPSSTELYRKMKAVVQRGIEEDVVGRLLPELRTRLDGQADALLYIDEVVEPVLLGVNNFVFVQLDHLVDGNLGLFKSNAFKQALSTLVYKIAARNVIVLGDIIVFRGIEQARAGFQALQQQVDSESGARMVADAHRFAVSLVPNLATIGAVSPDNVQMLISDILAIAQEVFSEAIWTDARRTRMRELMLEAALNEDRGLDYRQATQVEQFFINLVDCETRPNLEALQALADLSWQITLDELQILIRRLLPVLSRFFLAVSADVVEELDRSARAAIDGLAGIADDILRTLGRWRRELETRLAAIGRQIAGVPDMVDALLAAFSTNAQKTALLNAIKAEGTAVVMHTVSATTEDWDLLTAQQKADALAVAIATFETAFELVRPVLMQALDGIESVGDGIVDLLRRTISVSEQVVAMSTDASNAVAAHLADQLLVSVNSLIGAAGLSLPDEITPTTIAAAVKQLLVTDELAALLNSAHAAIHVEHFAQQHQEASATYRASLGGPIGIEIVSPAHTDIDKPPVLQYGRTLPLHLKVSGASPSFVEPGFKRIFVAINGVELSLPPEAWHFDQAAGAMSLRVLLRHGQSPLNAGLNMLECSVSDTHAPENAEPLRRQTVSFVVDIRSPGLEAGLLIVDELSQFDAPGDDHQRTSEEYVVIANNTGDTIALQGWQIADRARHVYSFGNISLAPATTLTLHTGIGVDSATDIFWGRKAAVWNNRGDTVYLIDADSVVRAEYAY